MRRSDTDYRVAHLDRARVFHAPHDADLVGVTHTAFSTGLSRVLDYLGVTDEFPLANLFLLPDRAEFDRFVAHLTPTPTTPGRVGQPQGHDLYLLSPTAYPTDASPAWLGPDGRCDMAMYARLIAHEAVHMAEEHLSPREAMENRPAWWSEGLAVLLSEQHRYDHDVLEHMRTDLEASVLPTLDEMVGGPAYTWAWAPVDCTLRNLDREKVVAMITGTSGADILELLGLERERFGRDWRSHATAEARAILEAADGSSPPSGNNVTMA